MSLDTDHIVDRRRMRRKLTFWRTLAVLIAIAAVIGVAMIFRGSSTSLVQATGPQISRVTIRGIIRGDEDRLKALESLSNSRATRAVIVHIDSPGPDGKSVDMPQPVGMLIYTRDGHISVQLMYPRSASAQSNEYVHDGYEASFGSYDVEESTHTLTHHVQASNTRDLLVGKNLPRSYQFTQDGHLIIKSTRPEEHWSVTWEHY